MTNINSVNQLAQQDTEAAAHPVIQSAQPFIQDTQPVIQAIAEHPSFKQANPINQGSLANVTENN